MSLDGHCSCERRTTQVSGESVAKCKHPDQPCRLSPLAEIRQQTLSGHIEGLILRDWCLFADSQDSSKYMSACKAVVQTEVKSSQVQHEFS
jgi:hypothetical protein